MKTNSRTNIQVFRSIIKDISILSSSIEKFKENNVSSDEMDTLYYHLDIAFDVFAQDYCDLFSSYDAVIPEVKELQELLINRRLERGL